MGTLLGFIVIVLIIGALLDALSGRSSDPTPPSSRIVNPEVPVQTPPHEQSDYEDPGPIWEQYDMTEEEWDQQSTHGD